MIIRPKSRRLLAYARARSRRDNAGAAMFIVAITLGLLAAMGVYGLTATAQDVKAAGHFRENAQAQAAAEHAIMLTAETFTPGTANELLRTMQLGTNAGTDIQTTNCKTARTFNAAQPEFRAAQACLSLSSTEMKNIAENTNSWAAGFDPAYGTFSPQGTGGLPAGVSPSFGSIPNRAFFRVEVTNPIDIPPPPGSGLSERFTYTQVTATVFIDMKANKTDPAESVAQGRGRLLVGPYFR